MHAHVDEKVAALLVWSDLSRVQWDELLKGHWAVHPFAFHSRLSFFSLCPISAFWRSLFTSYRYLGCSFHSSKSQVVSRKMSPNRMWNNLCKHNKQPTIKRTRHFESFFPNVLGYLLSFSNYLSWWRIVLYILDLGHFLCFSMSSIHFPFQPLNRLTSFNFDFKICIISRIENL